jgi:putative NIF3 family GTP cyclohydrolase 1 type 2
VARERDVLAVTERRQPGVDAYDHAWTLMEKPDRTCEENDAALHEMHASADRAKAVAEDADAARRHDARAHQLGEQVEEEDARERLFEALETLPL